MNTLLCFDSKQNPSEETIDEHVKNYVRWIINKFIEVYYFNIKVEYLIELLNHFMIKF